MRKCPAGCGDDDGPPPKRCSVSLSVHPVCGCKEVLRQSCTALHFNLSGNSLARRLSIVDGVWRHCCRMPYMLGSRRRAHSEHAATASFWLAATARMISRRDGVGVEGRYERVARSRREMGAQRCTERVQVVRDSRLQHTDGRV
jgi:hypothetical protein